MKSGQRWSENEMRERHVILSWALRTENQSVMGVWEFRRTSPLSPEDLYWLNDSPSNGDLDK